MGQDRLIGRPTTTTDGSTAAVEEAKRHVLAAGEFLKGDLGLMNLPVAGEEAGILVAVGVAQHQLLQRLLLLPHNGEEFAVKRRLEQTLHHLRGPLEILHGFEQRHHQQGGPFVGRVYETRFLGQQQDLQEIRCRVAHGDHVGVADPRTELLLEALQHSEHRQRLGRRGRPAGGRRDQGPTGLQFLEEPCHPLRLVHVPIGLGQFKAAGELVDGIAVAGALLTDVQAGQ